MAGTAPACAFDALFDGGSSLPSLVRGVPKVPSVPMNMKVMEEEAEVQEEEMEGEEEEPNTITVRKFSTMANSKKVVEEAEVRRVSDGRCPLHRVLILGSAEVGKTSLVQQLPSSCSLRGYAGSQDSSQGSTAVCEVELDSWRANLQFSDLSSLLWLGLVHGDPQAALQLEELEPSVLVVVYAVDDNLSLTHASRLLSCMKRAGRLDGRTGLLVGNKTDLVRSRQVTPGQGTDLAARYQLAHLEVSSGLGYNLDQLLVLICQGLQAGAASPQTTPAKKSSIRDRVLGLVSKKYSK